MTFSLSVTSKEAGKGLVFEIGYDAFEFGKFIFKPGSGFLGCDKLDFQNQGRFFEFCFYVFDLFGCKVIFQEKNRGHVLGNLPGQELQVVGQGEEYA